LDKKELLGLFKYLFKSFPKIHKLGKAVKVTFCFPSLLYLFEDQGEHESPCSSLVPIWMMLATII
jgi:hypothetical protein